MILIRHKGEELLVESTAGYPGCKVIARDVPHPPGDCRRWQDGAWVECPKLKAEAKAARLKRAKEMLGPEVIEEIIEEAARRARGNNR